MNAYLQNNREEYLADMEDLIFTKQKEKALNFAQTPIDTFIVFKTNLEQSMKTELNLCY